MLAEGRLRLDDLVADRLPDRPVPDGEDDRRCSATSAPTWCPTPSTRCSTSACAARPASRPAEDDLSLPEPFIRGCMRNGTTGFRPGPTAPALPTFSDDLRARAYRTALLR